MPPIENSKEQRGGLRGWLSHVSTGAAFDTSPASNQAFRVLAAVTFLLFLASAVRSGWMRSEGDFPNYYAGAFAARHGEPLRDFYDWTWFERQVNYAGFNDTLGAYEPQTPLTMLPFVPLTPLSPQNARRIWLLCNLLFLVATIWMLARLTGFSIEQVWLLMFCCFFPLYGNFLGGQYYAFLLFLLTLSFYLLSREHEFSSGSAMGIAFALKLYGGPFLLYFLFKRRWRAVAGMIVATGLLGLLAVGMFGARDVYHYATQIFPRSLEGEAINAYAPTAPVVSTFLKHLLVAEPELNPHPAWNAPWLAFFLQALVSAAVIIFICLGTNTKRSTERRDFAWFTIAALLLSTNIFSYTYMLLVLPNVLLLAEAGPVEIVLLFAAYVLLAFPLPAEPLFPKLWILLALFLALGYRNWAQLSRRVTWAAAAVVLLAAFVVAHNKMSSYMSSPARLCEPVDPQPTLFSSFPVISRAGLFYQSMEGGRYVLRWLHKGKSEVLRFAGEALHPRAAADGESVKFELVANRGSKWMLFDPATHKAVAQSEPVPADGATPIASPDGKWTAYESSQTGSEQIWVRNRASGKRIRLTGGNCNNSWPAWELDSNSIVFASDCNRSLGLPALYRVRIPRE